VEATNERIRDNAFGEKDEGHACGWMPPGTLLDGGAWNEEEECQDRPRSLKGREGRRASNE